MNPTNVVQSTPAVGAVCRPGPVTLILLALLGLGSAVPVGAQTLARYSASQLAAGASHTCALTGEGAVQCWGDNTWGQLGDRSTTDRDTPAPGGEVNYSAVAQIALGLDFSCALGPSGNVDCWGHNNLGQLGLGGTVDENDATPLPGLQYVVALAAGGYHACALLENGSVKCWGNNTFGEVGDASSGNIRTSPVQVSGLSHGMVGLSLGFNHSCALRDDGTILCWGRNADGQLGTGGYLDRAAPVAVALPAPAAQVVAGAYHTCARTTAGAAYCWGYGIDGELGNGGTASSAVPQPVSGLDHGIVALYGGSYHTCAVDAAGTAKCWGWNADGQLGDNSYSNALIPHAVNGFPRPIASMAIGDGHTCAADAVGAVMCWGRNADGQLGNGKVNWTGGPSPYDVVGFMRLDVIALSSSGMHTCALTATGSVVCWGANNLGQLGDQSTIERHLPVRVYGFGTVTASWHAVSVVAGGYSSCALIVDGHVWCWGNNYAGQVGDGTSGNSRLAPVEVAGLTDAVAIAVGEAHACAVLANGSIKCWGRNDHGQLGNGTTSDSVTPVSVAQISNAVAIDAGGYETCALLASGAVQCWGSNATGQLGVGDTLDRSTPVTVANLPPAQQVSVGMNLVCALLVGGTVECWGAGSSGQLGHGDYASYYSPVAVTGLANVISVSADAWLHACAVLGSGAVKCWGGNLYGALGDGTSGASSGKNTPVDVGGMQHGAVAVVAGAMHSCALLDTGVVKCWGLNNYGQLGNATTDDRTNADVTVFRGQAITVEFPASLGPQADFVFHGSSGSGRLPHYETWSEDICSTGGSSVLSVNWPQDMTGLCGVRAIQEYHGAFGGNEYAAAPQQLRLIRITGVIFKDGFE